MNIMTQTALRRKKYYHTPGDDALRLLEKVLPPRHAVLWQLLRNWHLVVGKEDAQICKPARLLPATRSNGGILYLKTSEIYRTELLYRTMTIQQAVNNYLGYHAVDKIVIIATVAVPPTPPKKANPAVQTKINDIVAMIDDTTVRQALSEFALSVFDDD